MLRKTQANQSENKAKKLKKELGKKEAAISEEIADRLYNHYEK